MSTQQDPNTIDINNPFIAFLQEHHDDNQDQQQYNSTPPEKDKPIAIQNQELFLHSIDSTLSIRHAPSQGISFRLWPAANTLVNLLDNISKSPILALLNNKHKLPLRILELGSGTGIVGIAAATILGANVTLTDLPHVLPNLHFNIDANTRVLKSRGGVISVVALRWGENEDMEVIGRDYDLILASDVVYHDHLYEPLLQTLRYLMMGGDNKMGFVMAHEKRWKKQSSFFKKANKLFDIDVIHCDVPSNGSRIGVVVYHIGSICHDVMSKFAKCTINFHIFELHLK